MSLVEEHKEISKMTIYKHIAGFPEQIEFALNADVGTLPRSSKVCICGMGASSLAGDIMSDYADGSSDVPIPVIRGIDLPRWVDHDTLVIAVSYSGNTKETLCLYDQAVSRGCSVICITSGGELMEKCAADDNTIIRLPSKSVSRGSLGYLIGYLAAIFEDMDICKGKTELSGMLDALKDFRDGLVTNEDESALNIAKIIGDRIPAIYGLMNMHSAAVRWKTQINENAKMMSFCGTLPEFNHNEIIGWTGDDGARNFVPVVLYDENASDTMRVVTDTTIDMFRERGLDVVRYPISGRNNMEKNLKCIMLGDIVSLYLAYFRGADPCSASTSERVKEHVDNSE